MRTRRYLQPIAQRMTVAAAVFLAVPALAGSHDKELQMSPISGDPDQPRRHFRLQFPAELSPVRANDIYSFVRLALKAGYARAGDAAASSYQGWRKFNTAPYLSATHGNHYLNNYVNETGAAAYGRFEKAGPMPEGTIVAKDSFTMTGTGEIVLGGLFVMEKMPKGFSALTGDWKYMLIQADGTMFGETNGRNAARVDYCIGCHNAVKHQDHLWFLPARYRAEPGK